MTADARQELLERLEGQKAGDLSSNGNGNGDLKEAKEPAGFTERRGVAVWVALSAVAFVVVALAWISRERPLGEAWVVWGVGPLVLAAIWLLGAPLTSFYRLHRRQRLKAKAVERAAAAGRIEKRTYRWAKKHRLDATDLSRARLVRAALADSFRRPPMVGDAQVTAFCFGEVQTGLYSSLDLRAPDELPREVARRLFAYWGRPKRLSDGDTVRLPTPVGALIEAAHRFVSAVYERAKSAGVSPHVVAGDMSLKEAIGRDGLYDLLVGCFAHSSTAHDGLVHWGAIEGAVARHAEWIFPTAPVTTGDVAEELTSAAAEAIGEASAHVSLKRTIAGWRTARRRTREEREATFRQGRPGLALGLGIAGTAALLPGFYFLAPASQWGDVWLLLVMACVAVMATLMAAGVVGATSALDPTFVCALVVLVFAGPLPAAIILIGTEIVAWLVTRHRGSAFFANVTALGWYPLIGAVLLAALVGGLPGAPAGLGAYLAIAIVGLAMNAINYTIMRWLLGAVRDGKRFGALIRNEFVKALPATLVMILVGVGTAYLYTTIGLAALALFALAALVPPLYIPRLVRRSDPQRIATATLEDLALDTAHLAGLKSRELRAAEIALPHVRSARMHLAGEEEGSRKTTMTVASRMLRDFVEEAGVKKPASKAARQRKASDFYRALHAIVCLEERPDGGGPLSFKGQEIPKVARLLTAVDAFWGAVNLDGLKPEAALKEIKAQEGKAYDPAMVSALIEVCAEPEFGLSAKRLERLLSRLPRPEVSPRASRVIGVLAGVHRPG